MKARLTPLEAAATIVHSSLPTVVTEGEDDYTAYRHIEESLVDLGVSLLPLSGRDVVLQVYRLIPAEFLQRTMFVVDQDNWIYVGIPEEVAVSNRIVTTSGYSVENDLARDGELDLLMTLGERANFRAELDIVCKAHSVEVLKIQDGRKGNLATHVNRILNGQGTIWKSEEVCLETATALRANYLTLIRGKTLFELLLRQLSYSQRRVKHSRGSLMEVAAAREGEMLTKIKEEIMSGFQQIEAEDVN